MNQKIEVHYGEQGLPKWIMEQLAMGTMEVFLPVCFLETEDGLTGVFQTEGCRPLFHIHSLPTEDVFQLLCQVIRQMENNEKHYLFPERYVVGPDSVCFDPLKNRVKMIFLPAEDACSGRDRLCKLIRDCKRLVSEEGQGYLESLAAELEKGRLGYKAAIRRCELLMQEIYVCDIP